MSPFTWEERGSIWGSECLVPSLGGVFEFEPHGFSEDFGFGLIQFTSGTSWLQSFPCSSQIGSRMNLALFNCLWYEALSSVPCVAAQFRYHAKCVLSCFSRVRLFVTPLWLHAPLSMGFSRQEYWGGLPCPPPGSLPYPGIEPMSLMSSALAGGFFTTSTTWEAQRTSCCCCCQVASVVSDSRQPHGLQPTRLLRPWDFPGTSTGVGCHCLLWTTS